MINSISTIESSSNNPFGKVSSRTAPSAYWVEQKPKNIDESDNYLAASLDKIKIITPDEARKTNNIKLIGLSIAGATILTAGTIFFLLKGGPKALGKNFNLLKNFLEKKVQKAKLDSDGVLSTTNKVYVYALDHLNKIQNRFGVVNNYNTVKDLLFKKIMGCNKYLNKAHNKITRFFERLGRKSVLDRYSKADSLLASAVKSASGKIKPNNMSSKEVNELIQKTQRLNDEILLSANTNFGKKALTSRYALFKSSIEELKEAFSKMKVFLSKDLVSEFMADAKIVKQRENVIKTVSAHRRELSYPISHLVKDTDDSILKMVGLLNFKDTERITSLRNLRSLVKKYARCKNPNMQAKLKAEITEGMEYFINSIEAGVKNKNVGEELGNKLISSMSELKADFINYKPGKLEELLSAYKKLLPKSEYAKVEKSYKSWLRSLDKSIKLETEDYFSKLRDLAMGSAPTDVLTVLGSLGILGYNLAKSKDNDQRTSIALKYGIPAIAGIGTMLYFNAKLFAGSKAFILTSILTLSVNRLGTWLDNTLKNYKQSKIQNPPKTV